MENENLSQWMNQIRNFLLDTLFPISCLGCGRDGEWLCDGCSDLIPLETEQRCPLCESRITPAGRTCFACRKKYSIDGLLVACSYRRPLVARLIQLLKYRFVNRLAEPLGKILLRAAYSQELPIPDLIIPVPLHPRRLRWRGFNQSALLARELGTNLTPGFPLPVADSALVRNRFTHPQMKIRDFSRRRENLRGAFCLDRNHKNRIIGKYVWLIDDVATTGSTLFECAATLKKAGAREVFGLVIARQEMKK